MNTDTEPRVHPLSPTQRLDIRARRLGHAKQVNNIAIMLLAEVSLDLDLLRRAAEEAVARNDSFAIRIVRSGLETKQYFGEREVLLLETVDFTGQTEEAMDRFFEKVARKPLPLYNKAQAKIYIVKAPDGSTGLFTCISHLIMDTWAISVFYQDVVKIYRALEGTPMPDPIVPYEEILEEELAYPGSPRQIEDRAYWQAELERFGGPPTYSAIDGTHARDRYRKLIRKPEHPFGHVIMLRTGSKHENLRIPPSDVEALTRFCAENRVRIQTVFLLALRTYLARVNGAVDDVSINWTVARRGTLREKRAGGHRATAMILRTVLTPEATFSDALQMIGDTQSSHSRHAEFPFMDSLKMQQATYGMKAYEWYAMVTFTMVVFDADQLGLPFRTKAYPTGTTPMPVYVILSGCLTPGSLNILYEFQHKRVSGTAVHHCHAFLLDVIRTGIQNPDITMRELLDLPVGELTRRRRRTPTPG